MVGLLGGGVHMPIKLPPVRGGTKAQEEQGPCLPHSLWHGHISLLPAGVGGGGRVTWEGSLQAGGLEGVANPLLAGVGQPPLFFQENPFPPSLYLILSRIIQGRRSGLRLSVSVPCPGCRLCLVPCFPGSLSVCCPEMGLGGGRGGGTW